MENIQQALQPLGFIFTTHLIELIDVLWDVMQWRLIIYSSLLYRMFMIQNPFASPRAVKQAYNYQSNLLCNLQVGQMLAIIQKACQTCPRCKLRKKNHYCIEPRCRYKELLCVQCDTTSISQKHYMHDHTYILPLLSRDIASNFYRLKRRITAYHRDIQDEIDKMMEYLAELRKVEGLARNRMMQLEEEELNGHIAEYTQKMEAFLQGRRDGERISEVLEDVHFKSAQECLQKEEDIRNEIIAQLNSLKWPKDPQKVLKEKLLKASLDEQKRQIFISCKRAVQVNEIDAHFRTCQEFYTQNLQHHPVQIKIEQDYLSKPKFYQSFIHHFRHCTRLAIENGTLAHLRTPLSFRKLKQLDFTFTCDMEAQGTKLDHMGSQLTAITLRRLRQEDAKVLKTIGNCAGQLRKIHIDFANKSDLIAHKELLDFLETLTGNNLVNFTLKLRTENEVKRLYGYLSKFYREYVGEGVSNLAESLLAVLELNRYLTKVVVEGVKPLSMPAVLGKLKCLPFLMDYKIYYQNVDLMTEVDDRQAKQLEAICYKRKRIFYALAKASKEKRYPRTVINRIVEEMLI